MKKIIYFFGFLHLLNIKSAPFEREIIEMVNSGTVLMSTNEYKTIIETLYKKSPCNLLVFGVGNDSKLWLQVNKGGKTVFIEDSIYWLEKTKQEITNIEAHLVTYSTQLADWEKILHDYTKLTLDLPSIITDTPWDIILIDAPFGGIPTAPGRMQSIYTTYLLCQKKKSVDIFVHDCDRIAEKTYTDVYFGKNHLVQEVERLRHSSNLFVNNYLLINTKELSGSIYF